MAHSRAALKGASKAQLVATLWFLLAFLKSQHPQIYSKAEHKLGLNPGTHHRKKASSKRKGKRKMSAKQRANAAKFKAFVKKHGRGPRKGEHL